MLSLLLSLCITHALSQWPNNCKLVTSCGRSSWNPTSTSDAERIQLMNNVHANGNGFIDLKEFINLNARAIAESCKNHSNGSSAGVEEDGVPEANLQSAFQVFDVDQNGFVYAEELHRVLVGFGDERVSLEDCRDMIQCVDADGDHVIDFREFEAFMSSTLICLLKIDQHGMGDLTSFSILFFSVGEF